jgi:Aromatic acid exporter family member 1
VSSRRGWRTAVAHWYEEAALRVRERGAKALLRAIRLTTAAVISYLVAGALLSPNKPIVAPLTTLLVVQVTLYSTLTSGLRRIISVIAGVVLAVLFSGGAGLEAWSLAALIAASLIVGQLLRLGDHLLEVPISAMLILAVGGAETPATARISETLVGAAVGVLYNVALPPPVESHDAGAAVERFAEEMATLLDRVADEISEVVTPEQVNRWLDEARRLDRHVSRVDRALVNAEEGRRLNVRALGTLDSTPSLRSGLDALEHCTVALRGLCRSFADRLRTEPDDPDDFPEQLRGVLALLLRNLAAAIRSFGRLVRVEAETAQMPTAAELSAALEAVGEARAQLTELLMIDPRDNRGRWELHGAMLSSVERILRELNVEERVRQSERRRRALEQRAAPVQAVDRLRTTSRAVVERPLRHRPFQRGK